MKPFVHAQLSANKHGGTPDDYIDIHNFLDSTKEHVADMRHRMILHNTFGIFLTEKMFGVHRTNSDGREYSVRDIAEEHVFQDLHFIPSAAQCIESVEPEDWMGGIKVPHRRVPLVD